MSELGELVAVIVSASEDECPFPHTKQDIEKLDNVFPPVDGPTKNDAEKLAEKMTPEFHFFELIDIRVNGEVETARFSAHHLIPGNEAWPKTNLRKWIDKSYGHIVENIGYDVNAMGNGVSLPGWPGIKYGTFAGSWSSYTHKKEYSNKCMESVYDRRQFHDKHTTYSEFVVKVLDKINEKLDNNVKTRGNPGCGHKKCKSGSKKAFNPPIRLINRLNGVAGRLEKYLVCSESDWQMPLYTSRWAMVYKEGIEETNAKKELTKSGDSMRKDNKKNSDSSLKAGDF